MTRTFTDDATTTEVDQTEEVETSDNGTDDAAEVVADDEADDAVQDDDDNDADDAEQGETPADVWGEAVDNILGDSADDNDAATLAQRFVATGVKDPQGELNKLSTETTMSIAHDNDLAPADKGRIFTDVALLTEQMLGILPEKRSSGGKSVDPAKVARENAVRLLAVRGYLGNAWDAIDNELREQCVVAGITTTDDLQEMDDNGEQFDPDLDTSMVTFPKKFGEALDYIKSVPGGARATTGTGNSRGEDFVAGQIRYDSKGNKIRFDGTHYFVTLKGQPESDTKYTSSSTAAKKEITGGEVNGKKHFSHHTDPTA